MTGSLDLEFAVTLPPGVTEEQLAALLKSQAGRLNQLLARPVLDVCAGSDPYASAPQDGAWSSSPGRGRSGYNQGTPADGLAAAHMDLLNHPTSPIGLSSGRDWGYWKQRLGSRICERKAADEQSKREREESAPAPFRARPVPPSVSAPLYEGIQAYARLQKRSRSADAGPRRGRVCAPDEEWDGQDLQGQRGRDSSEERRPASRAQRELRDSSEERPPPFRARPVPWCVSAPLYDQMLIEDSRARQERMGSRSRENMRSSSLPPRLEGVRARLCGDERDPYADAGGCAYRASTPVPARHLARRVPESRIMNRPMQAELPKGLPQRVHNRASGGASATIDAAENLARDVASGHGAGRPGQSGWGTSSVYGSAYGISHIKRHKTPPRTRGQSVPQRAFSTTEVPDFEALHEKQRRDRMKYSNREATQPEPFVFAVPSRSLRMRQAPLPKDPSRDPRFHRRPRSARARSSPGARSHAAAMFAGGGEGGSPSIKALERPHMTGPPKTTAKTLLAQQHIANHLTEQRVQRVEKEQRLKNARKVDPEIKKRVMRAVGPVESIEERVDRKVGSLKQGQRETMQTQHTNLKDIHRRVDRRPLLMQQTDSVARARRAALFQFRGFLKDAGVADPDAHFQDDELDEIDRVRSDDRYEA